MRIRIAVLAMTMLTMTVFGGIITAGVLAEEEAEPAVIEEVTEPEIVPEAVEPATPEEVPEATPEAVEVPEETPEATPEAVEPATPEEIIAEQTGLTVDKAKKIDSYKTWAFYEVFADGDIYAVTIKNNAVDVCVILN